MKRIFGEYGLFIITAIISMIILVFVVSGQGNGLLGSDNLGGVKPAQTTKSENNSSTIQTLYEHKDPLLTISPVTLTAGNTYNFYMDFTTEAKEYASDGSSTDIKDAVTITEMSYLSRSSLGDIDATRAAIDLSSVNLSAYTVPAKGIYEITYLLTDSLGFETTATYQFPCD